MNDLQVTHTLNAWATHHDGAEDAISAYAAASEALFVLILVALFAAVWGRLRTTARRAAVAAAASAGVALLVGQVVSRLVERPRPFVAHPDLVHLFAPHVADASFPSDHATAAFAIATAVLLRHRAWGAVLLAAAAALAASRVVIGVHYPLDVLGGAALGAGVALLLFAPLPRRLTDRLADAAGRRWDAAARGVRAALPGGR